GGRAGGRTRPGGPHGGATGTATAAAGSAAGGTGGHGTALLLGVGGRAGGPVPAVTMGRRPFDPRLLRRVPAVRLHLAGIGLLGGAAAAVVVGQAVALATTLAAAAEGRLAVGALLAFLAAVAGRAGWIWLSGLLSARTAARVKQELRGQLATAIARRGPAWSTGRR